MDAKAKSWEIVCRVVDNYGDAGVAWRLARQIADEHGARVRIGNRTDEVAGLSESAQSAGAQVSLSFSNLAAAPASTDVVVAGSPPLAH